ncbi:hypothetical protein [Deinococcus phoenicis]|nr:hypothetical protein [Deinococcus phoenicis]
MSKPTKPQTKKSDKVVRPEPRMSNDQALAFAQQHYAALLERLSKG